MIATGLASSRPDLSVWVVTGDGDSLSIGGNHLIHALRRNVNLKILLFNNRIYGLTKGQYSPTSEVGKITKSTPMGSLDAPFNPISLAIGAEASFVARTIDSDRKHLQSVLRAAAQHNGTALVEIYQNCNIFNDDAFLPLKDPARRDDVTVRLEHGEPIVFGAERDKALRRTPSGAIEVVSADAPDILVHDAKAEDPSLAFSLSRLDSCGVRAHPDRHLPPGRAPDIRPAHARAARRGGRPAGPRRPRRPARQRRHLAHRLTTVTAPLARGAVDPAAAPQVIGVRPSRSSGRRR